jgi:hypothetical protein
MFRAAGRFRFAGRRSRAMRLCKAFKELRPKPHLAGGLYRHARQALPRLAPCRGGRLYGPNPSPSARSQRNRPHTADSWQPLLQATFPMSHVYFDIFAMRQTRVLFRAVLAESLKYCPGSRRGLFEQRDLPLRPRADGAYSADGRPRKRTTRDAALCRPSWQRLARRHQVSRRPRTPHRWFCQRAGGYGVDYCQLRGGQSVVSWPGSELA